MDRESMSINQVVITKGTGTRIGKKVKGIHQHQMVISIKESGRKANNMDKGNVGLIKGVGI